MERELNAKINANLAASSALCEQSETECEEELDELAAMRLPSLHAFDAGFGRCRAAFGQRCAGPAKAQAAQRLERAAQRARAAFRRDYNNKLYTGMVVLCLAAAVVFRFVLRSRLLELAGWLGFAFLQTYPYLHPGGSAALYDTRGWKWAVAGWEALMAAVFGFPGAPYVIVAGGALLTYAVNRRRRLGSRGGGSGASKRSGARDLDV